MAGNKYIVVSKSKIGLSQIINDCDTDFCFPLKKGDPITLAFKKICNLIPEQYILPIATNSNLGGVKIGSGINISQDGTISVGTVTESDPIFTAWLSSTPNISEFFNDLGYITTETDPVFLASEAAGIDSTDTNNWNTAFSWGNHSLVGYLTSESDPIFSAWLASNPLSGYLLSSTAASTYVSLTGSYSNPSWITDFAWSKLTGVPSTFIPSAHTHALSDITQSSANVGQIPQWNGTSWVPISFSGSGWELTGNSGLNASVNFLGTTDNVDLVFRRNNLERLRLTNRDGFNSLEFIGTFRIFNPLGASGQLYLGGGAASQANIIINGSAGGQSNRIFFNIGSTNRATLFTSGQWAFNLPGGTLDAFNLYADSSGTGTLFQVWGAATTRMLYSYQGNLVLGTDVSNQVSNAILQLHSTTKGFLLPRMTTVERNAITVTSTSRGLMMYDTTVNKVSVYDGTSWRYLAYE